MKIAIYQPRVSYYVGGGEIVPLEHAHYLSKIGHDVTIVTTEAPFIKKSDYFVTFCEQNKNISIKYLRVPVDLEWIYKKPAGIDWQRWNEESFYVGRIALDFFSKNKFDVIALHNTLDSIAVPLDQKSVLHLHGYPPSVDSLQAVCLTIPNGLIAVSKYIKEKWQKMVSLPRCEISTNGIRSDYFLPNKDAKKIYDILYIGRLIPIKGVEYLIRSVAIIKKKFPDILVVIAGNGPEKKKLESLTKNLGLSKNINFIGYVKAEDLVSFYNSAKIAILPSYDREGVLTSMLEASSCGIPVITTTACSMREFLKDRVNGLMVKPKDYRSIAKATINLLDNESMRRKIGEKARKTIVSEWDWSKKILKVGKI